MSETGDMHGHGPGEPTARECADFLDRIVYFIDNELDEADCSVVRAHLDSCNPCLERYDLQRTVKSIVARISTGSSAVGVAGVAVRPITVPALLTVNAAVASLGR